MVTGGTGFLGRVVVEKLCGLGANVGTFGRSKYDLRFVPAISGALDEYDPQMVIHLAALVGGIGANQARPAEFFYDNLMMGVQLMHECWRRHVEKFVAVGTVCGYPKMAFMPFVPFRELSMWDGYPEETNAPYGLAKKMLLVQSQAYRQQYGFNSIFLVPTNLYGPGDNFDPRTSHVIPAMIRKFVECQDREMKLWGDGSPTRDFLYVDDAADAIILAAEMHDSSDPINLGTGTEISMAYLAHVIRLMTGSSARIVWDPSQPNGQPRRCLDVSRAADILHWRAKVQINDGLQRTIEWYRTSLSRTRIEKK